jgi:hypothetical protein|tara:strand:+ start:41 stop:262 length:222 start_codon:yes stop_codon:yes gene_type:complete
MKNVSIWNITFDIDGQLYVLDEQAKRKSIPNMIAFMLDNLVKEDLRPIDKFDIDAILEHEGFWLDESDNTKEE